MRGYERAGPPAEGTAPNRPPEWLAEVLGGQNVAAHRTRWGFRHETWIVELGDGGTEVFQRRADNSDPTGPGPRAVRDLVRGAGLPVPEPVEVSHIGGRLVVRLPRVEGIVSAELLGTVEGAGTVGRLCGEVAARFGRLDPNGIELPRAWANGEALRGAMRKHLDRVGDAMPSGLRRGLRLAVDRAAAEADRSAPRVVHGDLAPVNVLVRDGRSAAVLDLDRVQLAHPLYDSAWFAWVVSFHHPDVADAACDAFALADGGLVLPRTNLAWLWPLQLLERLGEAETALERSEWRDRLLSLGDLSADDRA